jgi:hypothetical protein
MILPGPTRSAIRGIVEAVDVLQRTVRIVADGLPRTLDLAPDCRIHLCGEPVKLRLLQPGDVVHVQLDDRGAATAVWVPGYDGQRGTPVTRSA